MFLNKPLLQKTLLLSLSLHARETRFSKKRSEILWNISHSGCRSVRNLDGKRQRVTVRGLMSVSNTTKWIRSSQLHEILARRQNLSEEEPHRADLLDIEFWNRESRRALICSSNGSSLIVFIYHDISVVMPRESILALVLNHLNDRHDSTLCLLWKWYERKARTSNNLSLTIRIN